MILMAARRPTQINAEAEMSSHAVTVYSSPT